MRKNFSRRKLRLFIPFRRKDHDLIDYIYMVYYPERAKLVRMPAHSNFGTQLCKYEYKFQLAPISNATFGSSKKYWILVHGRAATDQITSNYPYAAWSGGFAGGVWYTNGQNCDGDAQGNTGHFMQASNNSPWSYAATPYGPHQNGFYNRMLAQKVNIVPTSSPEKRTGTIAFVENPCNLPLAWAPYQSQENGSIDSSAANPIINTSLYRNNDNCSIYPLAGSTVFHSTWVPHRESDRRFVPYNALTGLGHSTFSSDAGSIGKSGYVQTYVDNNYFSNMVLAEGCDASEVFECTYTVIIERSNMVTEQSHGSANCHNDGLSAFAAKHQQAINSQTALGTLGYHNAAAAPLSHTGHVISQSIL